MINNIFSVLCRTLCFAVFIFCPHTLESQELYFDYFVTKQVKKIRPNKPEYITTFCLDTNNAKSVSIRKDDLSLIGELWDMEKNIKHYCKISKYQDNYNFMYDYSGTFSIKSTEEKYLISIINKDQLHKQVEVSEDTGKTIIIIDLELEPSDFEYYNISADDYFISKMINQKLRDELKKDGIFRVKYYNIKFLKSSNIEISNNLTFQKIDFSLVIPNILIFKPN